MDKTQKTVSTKPLLVKGMFQVSSVHMDGLRPHLVAMATASLAEDGCIEYCYAEDIIQPGLIRTLEVWRDQVALDTHFKAPHIAAGFAAASQFEISNQKFTVYDISDERILSL